MKFKNSEISGFMDQNLSTSQLAKAFDELLAQERKSGHR
jgi:hypothetical protein